MEVTLIKALLYSILPSLIGLFLTGRIKSSFDKKLERLKKDHIIDISRFQAEIAALKTQENFKFTKLHEKRFIVLEKLYKLLNNTSNQLSYYISPVKVTPKGTSFEDYENKLQSNFTEAHNEFVQYYSDNKIYLNEKIVLLIDNYLSRVSEIYKDYATNHFLKVMGDKSNPDIFNKAATAYRNVPEKITPIRNEIEKKFKELLER